MATAPSLVVDWQALLNDLRRRGLRTGTIAEQVGLSSGNLREYRLGLKCPMHANGERLIEFYLASTMQTRDRIPMREAV